MISQIKYQATFLQVRALNLDLIKRRLDRCLYKRLDLFQRDIFSVLERARKLSRTDSQIFEDSYELQKHFIKIRDEVCFAVKVTIRGMTNEKLPIFLLAKLMFLFIDL